jgi:uncharacterized protein YbjT (DUF2867 family)
VSSPRVFITGVRAKTGAPLAELLAQQQGVEVAGGTRDLTQVDVPGVEATLFSWSDAGTWPDAVRSIDALFVVRPDRPDAPELISDLVARTPTKAHVVLLSEVDGGYFAPDDWAPRVERVVRDSGRTWTILRPGWFMQVFTDPRFFLDDLIHHGRLAFPSAGESLSWIDARDIAAVATRALVEPGHAGQVYELTGPQALTLPRTAELLSNGAGRSVEHVELSMDEALAGSEGFTRRNDEGAFERVRQGLAKAITDTVEQVTGQPARTLAQFVEDYRPFSQFAVESDPSSAQTGS